MNRQEFIEYLQEEPGGTQDAYTVYKSLKQIELTFPEAYICEEVSIYLASNLAYEEYLYRCSGATER